MEDKIFVEILKYLPKQTSSAFAILVPFLFLAILRWDQISKIIDKFKKKPDNKRTCGDCILILSGIREKYNHEIRSVDNSLLRTQMTFAEQKIQSVIFSLSQNFYTDIQVLEGKVSRDKMVIESAFYCETLKNSMLRVKDELRRSFKENGFHELNETDFSHYVEEKLKLLIIMIKEYLDQYYTEINSTVLLLKDRFKSLDDQSRSVLYDWCFDIFNNARIVHDNNEKTKCELGVKMRNEIDDFVNSEKKYMKLNS